jgi:hypothetical protein
VQSRSYDAIRPVWATSARVCDWVCRFDDQQRANGPYRGGGGIDQSIRDPVAI